jgi:hypothetical protein
MFLFKARQAAQKEYGDLLDRLGISRQQVSAFFAQHPRFASPLRRSPHAAAGTAADRLAEIAPLLGKSALQIRSIEARAAAARAAATLKATPRWLARMHRKLVLRGPDLLAQAREEWAAARPELSRNLRQRWDNIRGRPPADTATPSAAA